MTTKIQLIISGGQTGADQGGLLAAEALGIKTGGWMPAGFKTEAGPRPDLAERFSLLEHNSSDYAQRTEDNIVIADGTLIFGKGTSSGTLLTRRLCRELQKPMFYLFWHQRCSWFPSDVDRFRFFIEHHNISILNVAGNRESVNPGIEASIKAFLVEALS